MESWEFFEALKPTATVLIPTFGQATFAHWTIESVRRQTIKDIEIFVICDGSPPEMVSFFKAIAKEDSRIRVFWYQKSERNGEPYRDLVIKNEARGKYIYYCSHDDLWFPTHIEELGRVLKHKCFCHSIHASVGLGEAEFNEDTFIDMVIYADLEIASFRKRMLNTNVPKNFFGLTYGAHTRKAYLQLKEGWTTTPPGIWTDLYMWRKFLTRFAKYCGTCKVVTALNFPAYQRNGWSEQRREEELAFYFKKILEPGFIEKVNEIARKSINKVWCGVKAWCGANFFLGAVGRNIHAFCKGFR